MDASREEAASADVAVQAFASRSLAMQPHHQQARDQTVSPSDKKKLEQSILPSLPRCRAKEAGRWPPGFANPVETGRFRGNRSSPLPASGRSRSLPPLAAVVPSPELRRAEGGSTRSGPRGGKVGNRSVWAVSRAAQRGAEKLRKEKAAAEGNYPPGDAPYDEEAELERALHQSRAEEEGGAYEHGGGSGSRGGNPMSRLFGRSSSVRQTPGVVDYNLGSARGSTQPRIDTGKWTQKVQIIRSLRIAAPKMIKMILVMVMAVTGVVAVPVKVLVVAAVAVMVAVPVAMVVVAGAVVLAGVVADFVSQPLPSAGGRTNRFGFVNPGGHPILKEGGRAVSASPQSIEIWDPFRRRSLRALMLPAAVAVESTKGRRKRQQVTLASASPYIPDDVVRRILLRLPSQSILRCRAVCKAWRQMASNHRFTREHHSLQPSLPLVSFLRGATSSSTNEEVDSVPVDCCIEAFDLHSDEFRPTVRFKDTSCGGRFDVRFYVCNPARHQWTHLPAPLPSLWFAGFHHHEPTGEYRALFYRDDCTDDQWPGTDYYILLILLRGHSSVGFYPRSVVRALHGGGDELRRLCECTKKGHTIVHYESSGSPLVPPWMLHAAFTW
ncbi:hypothetical protein HU200_058909 [Digitaria exilis]|uniref:F-box domain-containing protein n=1 Tax=Digitaria exilis TaxID=1010633 RepID=A0A835ABZ4_9POAL|nr:hypothetical protein HU200_058909 [Digitaria exilis]